MSWQESLKILNSELKVELTYVHSKTSSVTTSWGVDWDETLIARDLFQNFFDANRNRISEVRVAVEGTKVTITGPTPFELVRLFYLGSEKGEEDIGQYGEGFKAAAVCLLRDYQIEPVVISGEEVVYLRIDTAKVAGTELQPVVYDFFRSTKTCAGTRLILRGCSKRLVKALQAGLTHFFYEQNPLLGAKLWSSYDGRFSIYGATSKDGHAFYRRLKRGAIPEIPVVLVIDKEFDRIEKKIRKDRDRNAFGEELMGLFYKIFARSGLKSDVAGGRFVVTAARQCWMRGHPLLSEIAGAFYYQWCWPSDVSKAVFGDKFYARSTSREPAQSLEYQRLEGQWRTEGRQVLPAYFSRFGVLNAHDYCEELNRKALEEQKLRHHRALTAAEHKSIRLLTETVRELAPATMNLFDERKGNYSVAETEVLLGELKEKRSYSSREVFLSSRVFVADFAEGLAVFLHEHTHIFGYDGSRGFTDALTELLEIVIRERSHLDRYEADWNHLREQIKRERRVTSTAEETHEVDDILARMNEADLRRLVRLVPFALLRRALQGSEKRDQEKSNA